MRGSFTLNAGDKRGQKVTDSAVFEFEPEDSEDESQHSSGSEPEREGKRVEDANGMTKVVADAPPEPDKAGASGSEPEREGKRVEDANGMTKVVADAPPEPDKAGDTTMIVAENVSAFVARNIMGPAQARTVGLMTTLVKDRRQYKKSVKKRIEDGEPLLKEAADRYKAMLTDSFDRLNDILLNQRDKLDGLIQFKAAMMMVDFQEDYEGKEDGKTTNQRPRRRSLAGQALMFWEWVIGLNIEDDVAECLFNPVMVWSVHDMDDVRNAITTGDSIRS
jgi:hypothetical protein